MYFVSLFNVFHAIIAYATFHYYNNITKIYCNVTGKTGACDATGQVKTPHHQENNYETQHDDNLKDEDPILQL